MPDDTVESTDSIKDTIEICAFNCTEQNVKHCRKCNRFFCIMHCNAFSPNFCKECFKDIAIVAEKFKRTFDHIADNGQMYIKTEERIKYYLDGMDWPFVTPWIENLSDEELRIIWVFHHCILRLIESENDTRNIEKNRKLRETPVARLITQTVSKKVTKVAVPETPDDMRKKWKKMGIPDVTIDAMILALKGQP